MRLNIRDTRKEHWPIAARAGQIFMKPEYGNDRYLFLLIVDEGVEYKCYAWRGMAPATTITVRVDAKGEDKTQKGDLPPYDTNRPPT